MGVWYFCWVMSGVKIKKKKKRAVEEKGQSPKASNKYTQDPHLY